MRHVFGINRTLPFKCSAKSRAESLIETLVSITVIVISTAAAMTVMRAALSGNQVIEKKIQAINLAEEGIEMIRNVRDTNYLLFSADPDNCWNALNVTSVTDCPSAIKISESKTYVLERDFSDLPYFDVVIIKVGALHPGTLDLYEIDLDEDGEGDADGDEINDPQIYAQSGISDPSLITLESEAFTRTFTIVESADGNSFDATVTVSWVEKGEDKSITKTQSIANIY